eukprot:gene6340-12_t
MQMSDYDDDGYGDGYGTDSGDDGYGGGSADGMSDGQGDAEDQIENKYYDGKEELQQNHLEDAVKLFQEVLDLDHAKGDKSRKALGHMTKAVALMGKSADCMQYYGQFLRFPSPADKVKKLLDKVANGAPAAILMAVLQATKDYASVDGTRNHAMQFEASKRLAGILQADPAVDLAALSTEVELMGQLCESPELNDFHKNSRTLEVSALRLDVAMKQDNWDRVRVLYEDCGSSIVAEQILSAKVGGPIQECGGLLAMQDRNFDKAREKFFGAYHEYERIDDPRRTLCLKLFPTPPASLLWRLILAHMLSSSAISPFADQATKRDQDAPTITPLVHLLDALEKADINAFEAAVNANPSMPHEDKFAVHWQDLLRVLHRQVLRQILPPYANVSLAFLAQELHVLETEVEHILSQLILDGEVAARIDQGSGQHKNGMS